MRTEKMEQGCINEMTFNGYQRSSRYAVQEHDSEMEAVSHWTIGLTEEAGEVASLIKHKYYNSDDISKSEIAEELGDLLWYLSTICTELGMDLEDIALLNHAKIRYRYTEDEFNKFECTNRYLSFEKFKDTEEYKEIKKRIEGK